MPSIKAKTEFDALEKLLSLVIHNGCNVGNYLEVSNILVEIEYCENAWHRFIEFKNSFLNLGGETAIIGWDRATRVYTEEIDRPTKPSYRKRLRAYPDKTRKMRNHGDLDQIAKIIELLSKKPGYSNLSFVFLRPADLHDQFRPGYVPCPIAGDFKFRDGALGLSIMFRTNDAYSVGYADILYLRKLQIKVLRESQMITNSEKLKKGIIGNLNLYFSRTYIEKSKIVKNPSKMRIKLVPIVNPSVAKNLK